MLRRRSIRTRIVVLVLVPVVALIGLYAVALTLTLSSYLSLEQAANVRSQVTNPVADVQLQLSSERGLALQYLADPTHPRLLRLLMQESKTDAAVSGYLSAARKTDGAAGADEQRAARQWAAELGTLRELRERVLSATVRQPSAAAAYSTMIDGADPVLTQAMLPGLKTSALIQVNDILTMEKSLQVAGEERDLVAADLATHSSSAADRSLLTQLIVQRRQLWDQAAPSLGQPYLDYFSTDVPASTTAALTRLENQIPADPHRAMRVSAKAWTTASSAYAAGFRDALSSSTSAINDSGFAQARGVLTQLMLIGGIGLLAIVVAVAVAIILSRALLQQLADLRLSALDLSSVRLPAVLSRLRSGEEIDVGFETPQLQPDGNEIGELGRAFNIAAQAAVTAAVDEAEIRRGVNDVFRNLARRNQSLLSRQLELLDAMERRAHDPEELADLFRVDHLTTRMRRHAEGLLIVAGGSSGRVWREPVPVVDVMRAAVAEIEDYTRIRVTSRSSSSIAGHAVADIIHMLAELVENATTFSPANTPVRIESDSVAKGLIVEIEDRGLGMTGTQIEETNSKLNDPPLLDLSGSEQLGLFIAGQLARRHDVKISMRSSIYGGITAVVLIPTALVVNPGYDEPLTVVGLRELGGRLVPQLPSAWPASDNVPGLVTTTAAQVDTGERAALADPGRPARYSEHELVSADLVDDNPVQAGSPLPDAGASGTEPAELKGAGAWLAEAATGQQPAIEADPGEQAPPSGIAPPPTLTFGFEPGDQAPDSAQSMTTGESPGRDLADTDSFGPVPSEPSPVELDGLPVRVRQANLAPQLRDPTPAQRASQYVAAPDMPAERPATAEPSPEAARSFMSALQRGWQRGRSVAEQVTDEPDAEQSLWPGSQPQQEGRYEYR